MALTVKWPSWWSGKWMKRYSVATSCMMESPRNSILWLWPLDKEAEADGESRKWKQTDRKQTDCSSSSRNFQQPLPLPQR